ncbi:hypothetical protein, partial [Mycolicibacter sinensis]
MPRPYPKAFRAGIIRGDRNHDAGATVEQVVTGFGVHPITFTKWLRLADTEHGFKGGVSTALDPVAPSGASKCVDFGTLRASDVGRADRINPPPARSGSKIYIV